MQVPVPDNAPQFLRDFAARLRISLNQIVNPIEPRRCYSVATRAKALELSAADWEGADVYIQDDGSGVAAKVYSDGYIWRRHDTNGAL